MDIKCCIAAHNIYLTIYCLNHFESVKTYVDFLLAEVVKYSAWFTISMLKILKSYLQ